MGIHFRREKAMTNQFFQTQIDRLKERFGERAFDMQFSKILWMMLDDMDAADFEKMVSTMIANRRHTNPPLEVDFREGYLAIKKIKFTREVEGAARAVYGRGILANTNTSALGGHTPGERRSHLEGILKKHYGVTNVADALEVAKIRLKVARANGEPDPPLDPNDPNFDYFGRKRE